MKSKKPKKVLEKHVNGSVKYKMALKAILSKEHPHEINSTPKKGSSYEKVAINKGKLKLPMAKAKEDKSGNNVLVSAGMIKKSKREVVKSLGFGKIKPSPKLFKSDMDMTNPAIPSAKQLASDRPKLSKKPSHGMNWLPKKAANKLPRPHLTSNERANIMAQVNADARKNSPGAAAVQDFKGSPHGSKPSALKAPGKTETLFSMFDKPKEYQGIREGKVSPKEWHPVGSSSPKSKTPGKYGTKVTKVTKVTGAHASSSEPTHTTFVGNTGSGVWSNSGEGGSHGGGSSGGSGTGSSKTIAFPSRPSKTHESYSLGRAFSAMFPSQATARAAASIQAGRSNRQIFRPNALTLRRSEKEDLLLKSNSDVMVNKQELEKSMKNHLMGVLAASGMHTGNVAIDHSNDLKPKAPVTHFTKKVEPTVSGDAKILHSISQVESSGGKNFNHAVMKHGMNAGTSAMGRYGLLSSTVQEHYAKHPKAFNDDEHKILGPAVGAAAKGDYKPLKETLEKNPELDTKFAKIHLNQVRSVVGKEASPERLAVGWNAGEHAAAKMSHDDVMKHPYSQKFSKYFNN